jgi:hypothetical protein
MCCVHIFFLWFGFLSMYGTFWSQSSFFSRRVAYCYQILVCWGLWPWDPLCYWWSIFIGILHMLFRHIFKLSFHAVVSHSVISCQVFNPYWKRKFWDWRNIMPSKGSVTQRYSFSFFITNSCCENSKLVPQSMKQMR